MKKTLVALMFLAGVSVAADYTLQDAALTLTTPTSGVQDISNVITGNAFTLAVTLDVTTIQGYLSADTGSQIQLINVGSNVSSITQGNRIGLVVAYNENGSAIKGTWNETLTSSQVPNGFQLGMEYGTFKDLVWTDITNASLVMSYGYSTEQGVKSVLTLAKSDGTIMYQFGGDAASGLASNTFDPNIVKFDDSIQCAYVYNTVMTKDEAKALGAKLAPEPTTATLSLLALAGLVARRRRK
ncbi:MAG: PEP-CTERM sorting domain-containing protein [Akkermansia sp.]|nr:PEP-CTERM sorting domain-containing protein [Akkermansia sp.]